MSTIKSVTSQRVSQSVGQSISQSDSKKTRQFVNQKGTLIVAVSVIK